MSFCMTKLEFPPEPYMLFRLGNFHIYAACFCIEFCQALLTLMRGCHAFKIKITYTPHIPAAPTLGVCKTCLPSRFTQKCSPTLGVNTKHVCQVSHPPNKCSKFLLLSLKSFVAEKRHGAMQKLFIKKERKNGQVSEILKTMGTPMPA